MHPAKEWSNDEISYVVNNWGKITVLEMCKHLQCSEATVRRLSKRMKLPGLLNRWTEPELQFLRDNAEYLTVKQAAIQLNRSTSAIRQIVSNLKIRLQPGYRNRAGIDMDVVKELRLQGMTIHQIADRLGCCPTAVYVRCCRLGLGRLVTQEQIIDDLVKGIHERARRQREANQRIAISKGWPHQLNFRHVQILELMLLVSVPMRRRDIDEELGTYCEKYVRDLSSWGLIACLPTNGKRRGFYILTVTALDMVKEYANVSTTDQTPT